VLFADGSVRALIDTTEQKTLTALMTRAGGEVVSTAALPSDPVATQFPTVVTVRIRGDGGQVRATIEPAEMGREDTPVRARPPAPTRTLPGPGGPR
jgi:hypothetical protein